MERIKGNKEIVVLLLIVMCFYVLMFLGGCTNKSVGDRNFFNSDLKVALICENNENEPFLEIGKKGVIKAGKELGMKTEIVLLNLDEKPEVINKIMNQTALDNNLVIVLGNWLKESVKVSARQLKSRNFAVVDSVVAEGNVKSVLYKSEEGALLMGIIAGGQTKSNKVGFIGGLNDTNGVRFLSGYAAGVKINNMQAYETLVDYSYVRYTEDFKDEKKAYEKAKELYASGCDIIFEACGAAGEGVFKAAKESGNKAIGVDVDCAEYYPEYKDVIISSMVKNMDKNIFDICAEIKDGKFKSGIKNLKELGISEGAFNYSKETKNNVSENTFVTLNDYMKKLKNKEIEVPQRVFEVLEFKEETEGQSEEQHKSKAKEQ